jgi:hypothetical protein
VRHWLIYPKRDTDRTRVIALPDAVDEWRRLGYRVDGPFVLEAEQPRGAVDRIAELEADLEEARTEARLADEQITMLRGIIDRAGGQ